MTSPGFDQAGDPPALIDLNQLIRETVESQTSPPGDSGGVGPEPEPDPDDPGECAAAPFAAGLPDPERPRGDAQGPGTITFTTLVDPRNWVVLEIRDSGCGMTPEVLKRATEPFFTTKPGKSGTGLTVAHGIWRRHRGALSIESQPGEGTMIRLAVEAPVPPSVVDQPPPPARLIEQPTSPPQAAQAPHGLGQEQPGSPPEGTA